MNIPIIYLYSYPEHFSVDSSQRLLNSINSAISAGFTDFYIHYFGDPPLISVSEISDYNSSIHHINYCAHSKMETFSRSRAINTAFKLLPTSFLYAYLCDIDIIFPPLFYTSLVCQFQKLSVVYRRPLRIIHPNVNILYPLRFFGRRFFPQLRYFFPFLVFTQPPIYFDSVAAGYSLAAAQPPDFAHGMGLIHVQSLLSIGGYDEALIGYGPEDDLFNVSISRINTVIYCKSNHSLTTLHQPHAKFNHHMLQQNMQIYRSKLRQLELNT